MDTTATTPAAVGHPVVIGFFHNEHNTPVYQVTPLEDGMELVEYLGALGHNVPEEAAAMVETARTMARVTGSEEGSNRWETRHLDGTLTVTAEARWYRKGYVKSLGLRQGVHRARLTGPAVSEEQQGLAAELAAQSGARPTNGMRWIVAELTGYTLVQNRPMEHRDCGCGNGVTTYYAGTVTGVTYWADNSVDVVVLCEDGKRRTVQTVAPHGDAC